MLPTPPPLRVAHLHCLYCGGERRGDDSACRKCLAEAPSVRCRACKAAVFAPHTTCLCGERCDAWGVSEPEGIACPRCHGKLSRVSVDEGDAHAAHVEQCARCLGCFARTKDFSELVERDAAAEPLPLDAFTPPPGARGLPRQDLLAETSCPYCHGLMERVRFAQKASILVDVCPKHGVWLDAGELPHLLDYVKHRAQGDATEDDADRQDRQHWDQVLAERRIEEQVVNAHLANAEAQLAAKRQGSVVFATAIGGPWLGLWTALRQRTDWRSR